MLRLYHKLRLHVGYYKLYKLNTHAKVDVSVVSAEYNFRLAVILSLVHPQLLPISNLIAYHIDLILCYHQGYNVILAEHDSLNAGTNVDYCLEGEV